MYSILRLMVPMSTVIEGVRSRLRIGTRERTCLLKLGLWWTSRWRRESSRMLRRVRPRPRTRSYARALLVRLSNVHHGTAMHKTRKSSSRDSIGHMGSGGARRLLTGSKEGHKMCKSLGRSSAQVRKAREGIDHEANPNLRG